MRAQMLSTVLRTAARPAAVARSARTAPLFVRYASGHAEESFESFSERYVSFFQNAEDLFEVQRGLNNCFAHDLVPSPSVVEAAVRAARRVNDYATAVRVFEGVKEKVENKEQYQAYLTELKPLREELGMFLASYACCAGFALVLNDFCRRIGVEGRAIHLIKTPFACD
jgi:cytochrome c oxidase subunit 5a